MSYGNKFPPVLRLLIRRNVKKNLKNYTIYFLTILFGVTLAYLFHSVESQFEIFGIHDYGSYLMFASTILSGASLIVCIIIGFIVSYANQFLMKRRKMELGIYLTLGMKQKEILKMILWENRMIGFSALAAGIGSGIVLSHGLAVLTARFMGLKTGSFHFFISFSAVIKCFLFFVVLFWFVNMRNQRSIRRQKLIDLLYASRKNEEIRTVSGIGALSGVLLSVIVLSGGYFFFLKGSHYLKMTIGLLAISAGTFMLFRFAGGFLLQFVRRRKTFYYQGIRMFSIRQIGTRFRTHNRMLSVSCILMFLSLTAVSAGLGMGAYLVKDIDMLTPYDVSAIRYLQDGQDGTEDILTLWESQGVPADSIAKAWEEADCYDADVTTGDFLLPGMPGTKSFVGDEYINDKLSCKVMRLSDYNRMRKLRGLEKTELAEDEFLIVYSMSELDELYHYYEQNRLAPLQVWENHLKLAEGGVHWGQLNNSQGPSNSGTIIVADELCNSRKAVMNLMNMNLRQETEDDFSSFYFDTFMSLNDGGYSVLFKNVIRTEILSSNLVFTYMAVYFGIAFMICACAVLALQQLTSASDNRERYRLLCKLGASEHMIRTSVSFENGMYFGIPFMVSLIHFTVVISSVYRLIAAIGVKALAGNLLFTALLLSALYGTYFCYSVFASKRMIDRGSF